MSIFGKFLAPAARPEAGRKPDAVIINESARKIGVLLDVMELTASEIDSHVRAIGAELAYSTPQSPLETAILGVYRKSIGVARIYDLRNAVESVQRVLREEAKTAAVPAAAADSVVGAEGAPA